MEELAAAETALLASPDGCNNMRQGWSIQFLQSLKSVQSIMKLSKPFMCRCKALPSPRGPWQEPSNICSGKVHLFIERFLRDTNKSCEICRVLPELKNLLNPRRASLLAHRKWNRQLLIKKGAMEERSKVIDGINKAYGSNRVLGHITL